MAGLSTRAKILLVTVPLGLCVAAWLGLWWYHDHWMISCGWQQKVRADLRALGESLDSWAEKHGGAYPATLDELLNRDALGHQYLAATRLPRDPWNREYTYWPGLGGTVLTYGRDGIVGGTGDDADIDYGSIVSGR